MPWNRRRLLAALPLPLAWASGGVGGGRSGKPMAAVPAAIRSTATDRQAPGHGAAAISRARVEVLALGTAQDGGVPQINCFKDYCARVRSGAAAAPRVACLGLLDHGTGQRFVIDATPDFSAQVGDLLAPDGVPLPEVEGSTVPLHDHLHGVLLTHAHIGHYSGLVHLGKEVAAPRGLPVWASVGMGQFLRANAPWEALFRYGFADLRRATPGVRIDLTPSLAVTPFQVVHRPEYSDTLGYLIHGPERTLMYVPDADVWDGWQVPFEQLLSQAQVALIDGSFWSHQELGHRVQADIPHPPVSVTIERLSSMPERPEVWFIHLNHTNPLWDPQADERRLMPAGFGVTRTGQRWAL